MGVQPSDLCPGEVFQDEIVDLYEQIKNLRKGSVCNWNLFDVFPGSNFSVYRSDLEMI